MVSPEVEVVRTVFDWSDGAVPVVHVVHAEAVGDAAAGESHESWFKVGERLHQVRTEVFEPVVGGARLQGDEIEIDDAFSSEGQTQRALRGHARTGFAIFFAAFRNGQRCLACRPCRGRDGDGGFADDAAVVAV